MRVARVLAVAAMLVTAAPLARATEMVHIDTRALVLGSNDIVVGRVESVTPHWNAAHTRILTDVQVRVTQSLKGASDVITLTQLGGEVGNVRYTVPGCPVFTTGEEALLFVWRDRRGVAQVNGLAQGKFDIRRDDAGVASVQRSVPGLAVRDARTLGLVPGNEPAPRVALDDMVREIQRVLNGEDGR
jgi:hypothetical protein